MPKFTAAQYAGAHDVLAGGSGFDILGVAQGNNSMVAGSGDNALYAGSGNDTMWGGGKSFLQAGSGTQVLHAGVNALSHDTLFAGTGDAIMGSQFGNNTLSWRHCFRYDVARLRPRDSRGRFGRRYRFYQHWQRHDLRRSFDDS